MNVTLNKGWSDAQKIPMECAKKIRKLVCVPKQVNRCLFSPNGPNRFFVVHSERTASRLDHPLLHSMLFVTGLPFELMFRYTRVIDRTPESRTYPNLYHLLKTGTKPRFLKGKNCLRMRFAYATP